MKPWLRIAIAIVAGIAAGAGGAWWRTSKGFGGGGVHNGPWTTALNYGTAGADSVTRAAVARRGILALPSTETVYWNASTDSDGRPLDGSCTYAMTGVPMDARWWSVTYYNKAGFLIENPANIWSFSGASLTPAEQAGWRVTIRPSKPEGGGHWLPSQYGEGFELTLRMYNPGAGFRGAPAKAALPTLKREACG